MTDDLESREPSERSANHYGRGLTIFFAVLVCYIFSPIPVAWGLMKLGRMDHAETALQTFYAPVGYVAENVEVVGKFYEWQVKLFGL